MTVSYPMYDRPETAPVQARFWDLLRSRLGPDPAAPATLKSPANLWDHWLSPDLLLSQTCGLPYRSRLHGTVTLLGTADYDLPGCPPGYYNSVFVLRPDGPADAPQRWGALRLAINGYDSQSGWVAPQNHMISNGYAPFEQIVETGSHRASVRAVTEGRADIACIDAQTWRLIQRFEAPDLQEATRTAPTPGLAFITARTRNPAPLRAALTGAIAALTDADRAQLNLYDLVDIPSESYLAVPTPPVLAVAG